MTPPPVFKDLVLVGGGHSHALVLRQWAMNPLPGVRITLISPQIMTPYSGMLPGLLAGHYSFEQTHIDLQKLALWAGIRYIRDTVINIDPEQQILHLEDHPAIEYDIASIDIGSTPTQTIEGAEKFTTPVKPISRFYARWQDLLSQAQQHKKKRIAVVGGGAGSVEVILSMAYRFKQLKITDMEFHLVSAANTILPNYNQIVRRRVLKQLDRYQIECHTGFRVSKVSKGCLHSEQQTIEADEIIWCTQASGADWLKKTPLDLAQSGFIPVRPTLQSQSFDTVFAAGDIANMVETPRPKAGVYAVRQAPILFHNLRAALLKQPLKTYKPQDDFLSLLALGEKSAAGAKFGIGFYGDWVWQLKDQIDRRFMDQFHQLPPLAMAPPASVPDSLIDAEDVGEVHQAGQRCNGCGGKIGSTLLQQSLTAVLGATYAPQDAVRVTTEGQPLYQSVDAIKSPVSDPWLFGRIAVNHALSDLYAMHLKPDSAQALIALPYAGHRIQKRELTALLQGIHAQLTRLDCRLLGGHSSEAREMSLGLVVNGLPQPTLFNKAGLEPGDKLVLSKPLGIGIILAAAMQNRCDGLVYDRAIELMLESNQQAATTLAELNVRACTDVTGFGLYGHLQEMCLSSHCRAQLSLTDLPVISGVSNLAQQGIRSSLYSQNRKLAGNMNWPQDVMDNPVFDVLFDPQTSGGLLAAIPDSTYQDLDARFHQHFYTIGQVLPAAENSRLILLLAE